MLFRSVPRTGARIRVDRDPLMGQEGDLDLDSVPIGPDAVRCHDPVAGHERRHQVRGACGARSAAGPLLQRLITNNCFYAVSQRKEKLIFILSFISGIPITVRGIRFRSLRALHEHGRCNSSALTRVLIFLGGPEPVSVRILRRAPRIPVEPKFRRTPES